MGTQMSVHTIKGDRDGHNENDVVRSHTCESASLKGLVKGWPNDYQQGQWSNLVKSPFEEHFSRLIWKDILDDLTNRLHKDKPL